MMISDPAKRDKLLRQAKRALCQVQDRQDVTNAELAERLGYRRSSETVVRRLRDPWHGSSIDAVDRALRKLGKRIVLTVEDSA